MLGANFDATFRARARRRVEYQVGHDILNLFAVHEDSRQGLNSGELHVGNVLTRSSASFTTSFRSAFAWVNVGA